MLRPWKWIKYCNMKLAYDLHIHSCLSPCGDEEMTPANIAGMCALAGLDVVALTDHNSSRNCAAFEQAARSHGLLAIPGMELCTREEVHVVCLFPDVEKAMAFSDYVGSKLPHIPNNPEIFGVQLCMDSQDMVLGEEDLLLAGAADIGLYEVPKMMEKFSGLAFPAHIDRPSNSLLSQMGLWMPDLNFPLAEVSRSCPPDLFKRPDLANLRHISACDAHDLTQIPDACQYMDIPERSVDAVFRWLKNGGM